MKHSIVIITGLFFLAPAFAAEVPIQVFSNVAPGIYRGARPEREGLEALAKLGIKTDLNLDNDDDANAEEAQNAAELGLHLISMPMSGFWTPHDKQVNQILTILADTSNYPIFVHCQHGQDRTGLIVGLFRVFHQQWTPKAAYEEMTRIGFHPMLFLLNHYYEEKTGFED